MTDLLHVLPDFPIKNHTHLIPSLEKHLITTSDLLTLDAIEIGRRAQLPILDLKRLINEVISLLHGQLGYDQQNDSKNNNESTQNPNPISSTSDASRLSLYTRGPALTKTWSIISTLDATLDSCLGGGIPTGYITEITGERYLLISFPLALILNLFLISDSCTAAPAKPKSSSRSSSPLNFRHLTASCVQPST